VIELLPTLDELWAMYAADEEALNARVPFPDWVRQLSQRRDKVKRDCVAGVTPTVTPNPATSAEPSTRESNGMRR
jgi:hypothetical protein